MTVVFFAMKHDDKAECDLFSDYLNSSNAVTEDSTKADVKAVSENIYHKGQTGNAQALDKDVDNGVDFFVAGFTPNSSRICQKFMVRNKFGKIIDNVKQHQQDMAICGSNGEIPLWRINKELVSPKASARKKRITMNPEGLKGLIFRYRPRCSQICFRQFSTEQITHILCLKLLCVGFAPTVIPIAIIK